MSAPHEISHLQPWLGLASFSEETRGFFYGRVEEVGELARRVQRKLLTVLFGQSGLGKTSILRAGIVPRLRAEGYCPVYVRVDYGPDAPTAAQQIKQAILRATADAGHWSQSGVAAEGESLWEFLHHRGDVLTDDQGKPLIPLMIFDQFEEIFTLAQSDDDGRLRAAAFIDALSELVENRPSAALEAKLEQDDSAVERFDFARSDYRVLIALREDYLAHLEGLKGVMPSITQNRMRLAPMTGSQALSAVRGPGGALVSEEVAEAIVRFVAGGSGLAFAQVEPSLLSLICRELNDARIASGRGEITLDLLAGSHVGILADFYERALGDQPPKVRQIVEDLLLTASGYRENVAEERMQQALAAAGAAPGTLDELVNRRLLHIEERLDVRRVELTHDVLCSVVRASRDLRQEREAREASALALVGQQERERTTHRALVRTRQVAAGCALLAFGAISASVYAYVASAQANEAEHIAQAARDASAKARGQAELLVSYLNDDFARELEGMASKEAQVNLSRRILEYYRALPNVEPGSDTERNRVVAMIRYANAARFIDRLDEAEQLLKQARAILEQRRAGGDRSEASAQALGLELLGERRLLWARGDLSRAKDAAIAASKVLLPWAQRDQASFNSLYLYAQVMSSLVWILDTPAERLAAYQASHRAYKRLRDANPNDIRVAIAYVRAKGEGVVNLVDPAEAESVGNEAFELGTQLIKMRPGDTLALRARADVANGMVLSANARGQIVGALPRLRDAVGDYGAILRLDPRDTNVRMHLVEQEYSISSALVRSGQPQLALLALKRAVSVAMVPGQASFEIGRIQVDALKGLAELHADLGDADAASVLLAQARTIVEHVRTNAVERQRFIAANVKYGEASVALLNGNPQAAIASVEAGKAIAQQISGDARAEEARTWAMNSMDVRLGEALLAQNKAGQALTILLHKPAFHGNWAQAADLIALREDHELLQATALVGAGRDGQARELLDQLVPQQRKFVATNPEDCRGRLHLAVMLALQARVEPQAAAAAAREAAALVKTVPEPMKRLRSVRTWLDRIAAFTGKGATA